MKRTLLLLLFIFLNFACVKIPYHDDKGFLNSAQANSFEFLVYVNGRVCKDMDGIVGMCSKRLKSTDSIEFKIEPLDYAYRVKVTCSKELGVNFTRDYPANTHVTFTITADDYQEVKTFVCIGELFPTDRPEEISFKWQIRVEVIDAKYLKREEIFVQETEGGRYLVLGQNARLSKVYINGKFYEHKEKAIVKLPKKSVEAEVKAMSESYMGRFNYFGF
jgi:hypothetical protein